MICGSEPFANDIRAIDWSSDGLYLAVCDLKAKVYLLNPKDLTVYCEF
jgi:hypothetical protein